MSPFALAQAISYLRRQKRSRKITHWELEIGDQSRRMFGVRVTVPLAGAFMNQRVSATHYGRDLLSAAMRAVAEVTR